MGRALAASSSQPTKPPRSYPSTPPIRPLISSRPNPFNAPFTSPLSSPDAQWRHRRSSREVGGGVMPFTTDLDENQALLSSPNYMTQSNDINLWSIKDEKLAPGLSRHPQLCKVRRRLVVPSVQDVTQGRQPRLVHGPCNAVTFWFLFAIFVMLLLPHEQASPKVYEFTPAEAENVTDVPMAREPESATDVPPAFKPENISDVPPVYEPTLTEPETVTDVLPLYDYLQNMYLRQVFLPRNTTFIKLSKDMLTEIWDLEGGMCQLVRKIGAIKGGPGPEHDGVNLEDLCDRTITALLRARKAFRVVLAGIRIFGPGPAVEGIAIALRTRETQDKANASATSATTTTQGIPYMTDPVTPPTPDPSPLRSLTYYKWMIDEQSGRNLHLILGGHLKNMNLLRQRLEYATHHVDQFLNITRNVTEKLTNKVNTEKASFWKNRFRDRMEEVLVRLIERDLDVLVGIKSELAVISSALEPLLDEQEAILHQEDEISVWIQELIDYASLTSQAGPQDTVRFHNATPYALVGGKWHTNPWAIYRPRSEKDEFGQWCVYPGCPKVEGDTILVRLHLPNPTDAIEGLAPVWNMVHREATLLENIFWMR
ncbi:hypothetical protein ACHAPT_010753 [Fusarium lateritium]